MVTNTARYNFDFTPQFIETEKDDAKPTYKRFLGYDRGIAVVNVMMKRAKAQM